MNKAVQLEKNLTNLLDEMNQRIFNGVEACKKEGTYAFDEIVEIQEVTMFQKLKLIHATYPWMKTVKEYYDEHSATGELLAYLGCFMNTGGIGCSHCYDLGCFDGLSIEELRNELEGCPLKDEEIAELQIAIKEWNK